MTEATEASLPQLIEELRSADGEHTDVSVSDESEWTLTVYPGGRVTWENVEADDEPRHLSDLTDEAVRDLLRALVRGDLAAVENHPWQPGY